MRACYATSGTPHPIGRPKNSMIIVFFCPSLTLILGFLTIFVLERPLKVAKLNSFPLDNFVDGGKHAICDSEQAWYDEDICSLVMKNTSTDTIAEMAAPDFFDTQIQNMIDSMNKVTFNFIFIGVAIWIGGMFQVKSKAF